jgi:acetate kinase
LLNILIFNCGSSSLSYKVFRTTDFRHLSVVLSGKAHRVGVQGTEDAFIEHRLDAETFRETRPIRNHREAATLVITFIRERDIPIDLIGHRFVHGGSLFQRSTLLDAGQLERLERCLPLAPIHNPNSLSVIHATREALPGVRQYVTFDSAFHASIPEYAHTYALPRALVEEHGFRKYGFHGLSYQDVTQKAAGFLGRSLGELRIVACHLGTGGSSVAAVRGGRSVDTSMGYSPLAGLVMSTRSGDIDPILPLHMVERCGYTASEVARILNKQSGLLGISGFSSDIRDLIHAMDKREDMSPLTEDGRQRARLAFEMYVYRLKQTIGSMAASLGGLDVLLFTDTVGLECPEVRAAACAEMGWCGVALDPARNRRATGETIARVSHDGAPVEVLVVPNDEELVIGMEGLSLLSSIDGGRNSAAKG